MIDLYPDDSVAELLESLRIDIECFNDPDWVDEDGDATDCSILVMNSIQAKFDALSQNSE